jgi:hypothetical protein
MIVPTIIPYNYVLPFLPTIISTIINQHQQSLTIIYQPLSHKNGHYLPLLTIVNHY